MISASASVLRWKSPSNAREAEAYDIIQSLARAPGVAGTLRESAIWVPRMRSVTVSTKDHTSLQTQEIVVAPRFGFRPPGEAVIRI